MKVVSYRGARADSAGTLALMKKLLVFPLLLVLLNASAILAAAEASDSGSDSAVDVIATTSFALRGEPKYKPGFTHFDYVNPDAPKGGKFRRSATGTFDNLNRYANRGTPPANSDALYDTLMATSEDELNVYYPLIADQISYASDYSYLTFRINPKARFQDGKPITAESVKFSFEEFSNEGVPQFKKYYSFVKSVEVDDEANTVTFRLEGANREDMSNLLSLRILPGQFWGTRDFGEPTKEIPVGSSGMTVKRFKFGQYIEYEYLDDYWAKDLPVNKGRNNFDVVRYDYYLDANVAFEGFKSGQFEFWEEGEAKNWATAYDFPAINEGRVKREALEHQLPQATAGFIFNTQRPLFKDRRVREALSYMLDFEWMNKSLFYDQYTRTKSFFTNTDYAATGKPTEAELAILKPMAEIVPSKALTDKFELPVTAGDGNIRPQMRKALGLLKEAGWSLKNGKLVSAEGAPFEFEFISRDPITERIVAPFKDNLSKIGITLNVRRIDASQFLQRYRNHDFDMLSGSIPAMATPSSDMQILFDSKFVDSTWNVANIQDPAIDRLVAGIIENLADDEALLNWGRAFDRVMLFNYFLIPQWNISAFRIAYWDKFERPAKRPEYDLGESTWWAKDAK